MNDDACGRSATEPLSTSNGGLSFEEVRRLLPQGLPFVFIDRVLAVHEDKSIRCLKNLAGDEPIFASHFPDFAIMPGVLLVECMAQASLLLLRICHSSKFSSGKLGVLGSVKARFLRPAVPGDQLIIDATIEKVVGRGVLVNTTITCNSNTVANGTLSFGFVDTSPAAAAGGSAP